MKKVILDANIDLKKINAEYISELFDDLFRNNRIRIVVGGTKLEKEYDPKFIPLVNSLKRAGRVETRNKEIIDKIEAKLKKRFLGVLGKMPSECDDHHIFALSLDSGCTTVVTKEKRMKTCIKNCRGKVGHANCPKLTLIHNKHEYLTFISKA